MKKFADIEYTRADMTAIGKDYAAEADKLAAAESYSEAKDAFGRMHSLMSDAETAYSIAMVRNTMDTSDSFYENEVLYYGEAFAALTATLKAGTSALLNSKFRTDFEAEYGPQLFRLAEADFATQMPENEQLMVREDRLINEYNKLSASCSVDFMGESCNFYGLLRHMQSTDRSERRAAFKEWAKLYESISDKLDAIYDELVEIRVEKAKNAGYDSYIPFCYLSRGRFDWNADDAERFRAQIKKTVTPAVDRYVKAQAERLGIDRVRYYDEELVYPDGNAKPQGTPEQLIAVASKMYHELSPETGEFFDFMTEHELFDLLTRPNKQLGGYCTSFSEYKAPFIFSNFNGTSADIDVLTHEAGHAFQYYLASRIQPIEEYVSAGAEICEIHSMSMELFAYPWTELFCGDEAVKYRSAHLLGALSCIPYLVSVDEFQQRVFESPSMSAAERRKIWRDIEKTYMPWRDYDGDEFLEGGGFWMQKQHIFMFPFYYLEYALSQICAFQFRNKMKTDREGAWADYLRLCGAGGSRGYLELLELAGLRSPFDEGVVEAAVAPVIDELNRLF